MFVSSRTFLQSLPFLSGFPCLACLSFEKMYAGLGVCRQVWEPHWKAKLEAVVGRGS